MKHSSRKLELAGQRFGKLTVLCPAENIGNRTAWICRCDCGRETVATTVRLRDGHCTSCGCDKAPVDPTPGARGRASLTYVDGTCMEMLAAKTVRKNNSSGVTGVDWRANEHVWRAAICFKGKRYYLGRYHNFDDAVKARKLAEENLHNSFLREMDLQREQSGRSRRPPPGCIGRQNGLFGREQQVPKVVDGDDCIFVEREAAQ